MKALNSCKEYKELIMEEVDGLISKQGKIILKNHINTCPDCRKHLKNMNKIRKTLHAGYEVPPFLEAKIMAKISGKAGASVWQLNLRPVFSFAASFGLVMIVSLFIIYKSFDNKVVTVADMPVVKEKIAAIKPEIKQPIKAQEPLIQKKELVNLIEKTTPAPDNSYTEEHGPSVKLASSNAGNTVTAPKNDVVKTGDSSGLVMLKPGVVATTTDNPLLDRDLAIVANNLINPLRGEFATITVKVTEPANVKIIVYDKSVRPISKILDAHKDRGIYEATWEGRTDNGETVSEGVYFVYIQIGTRVIKKSIIVNK